MNWYWHLFDWVPYGDPKSMFLLGGLLGGAFVAVGLVLFEWWSHHARALDREDGERRRERAFKNTVMFATVSWGDMARYVEFPVLPREGATLLLNDGARTYALRVINHEWYVCRARAEVEVHCEVVLEKANAER